MNTKVIQLFIYIYRCQFPTQEEMIHRSPKITLLDVSMCVASASPLGTRDNPLGYTTHTKIRCHSELTPLSNYFCVCVLFPLVVTTFFLLIASVSSQEEELCDTHDDLETAKPRCCSNSNHRPPLLSLSLTLMLFHERERLLSSPHPSVSTRALH